MPEKYIISFSLIIFSAMAFTAHDKIFVGHLENTTGEFKKYSRAISIGITTCFAATNSQGGVQGRKLELLTESDSGNPITTQEKVEQLQKRGVHFFLGNMGTRTTLALLPKIKAGQISMLFPWSGDKKLRDPALKHIINGPGLMEPQVEKIAHYISKDLSLKRVGIFHADDTFSTVTAQSLTATLTNYSNAPLATDSYNRFTLNFKKQTESLAANDPRAVAFVSTSLPAVKVIKSFFESGLYGASFFGIDSTFMVKDILHNRGISFHYTSPVPHPKTSSLALADQYKKHLKEFFPEAQPDTLSFTYYLCAAIFVDALKQNTSPGSVISSIEKMHDHDIGGFKISFDPTNRHAFGSQIYLIKD